MAPYGQNRKSEGRSQNGAGRTSSFSLRRVPSDDQEKCATRKPSFLAFGFRLAFLVLVAANDPRDVRLSFFLFFQKGVLIVSCRNLGSVIADVDDLLVLLDRNVVRPLFGVFE